MLSVPPCIKLRKGSLHYDANMHEQDLYDDLWSVLETTQTGKFPSEKQGKNSEQFVLVKTSIAVLEISKYFLILFASLFFLHKDQVISHPSTWHTQSSVGSIGGLKYISHDFFVCVVIFAWNIFLVKKKRITYSPVWILIYNNISI